MPVVNLFDAQRDRIHVIAGGGWIAIAADQPNQVIEAGIAFAGILPPGAALRGTVGERLFDPAFIGADVAQVDRREEDLYALLAGFTDDPVGVFEVRLVGRREIAGNQERRLPVAIDRTMEFMLDEIDDDGIEALAAAVFQAHVRFWWFRSARAYCWAWCFSVSCRNWWKKSAGP